MGAAAAAACAGWLLGACLHTWEQVVLGHMHATWQRPHATQQTRSCCCAGYVVVTNEATGRTIPNAFLDKVKEEFVLKYADKGKAVQELGLSSFGCVVLCLCATQHVRTLACCCAASGSQACHARRGRQRALRKCCSRAHATCVGFAARVSAASA